MNIRLRLLHDAIHGARGGMLLLPLMATLAGCAGEVPAGQRSDDIAPPKYEYQPDEPDYQPDEPSEPDAGLGGTDVGADHNIESLCAGEADDGTVALYTFEGIGNTTADVVGQNEGLIRGSGISRTPGKSTCGKALHVPQTGGFLEIPHSNDWLLERGAVDLWVRFDDLGRTQPVRGIISRDALGTNNPNHLTVYRACDNSIVVRYQLGGDDHYHQCSKPVSDDTWHHVGVNFGAPGLQLFVNGNAATRTDAVMEYKDGTCVASANSCGRTSNQGIDGNNNPWVLGATSWVSHEGSATPVGSPLSGTIDSVRISSDHRAFHSPIE